MANTAILMASVNELPYDLGKVNIYKVTYDTPGVNVIVFAPSTGKSFYLKGIFGSEATVATELDLRLKQRSPQLTGTITATNGSTAITGSGTTFNTDFLTDLDVATEIVVDVTGTRTRATIASVNSDTSITLSAAYTGVTGSAWTIAREDTFIQPELNAFQGMLVPVIPGGWILAGKPNWQFIINSSVIYTQLLVMLQEGVS